MNISVQEIMQAKPEYVEVGVSVGAAVRKMQEKDLRHLPVLSDDKLVGIISDRDVRSFLFNADDAMDYPEKARKRLDAAVADLMSSDVITVDTEAEVSEVIEIMLEERVGAVPVLDAHTQRLAGIISYEDILEAILPFLEDFEPERVASAG